MSIAGGGDVTLTSPADNEILKFDTSVLKWKNAVSTGLPAGGTTDQIVKKNSNINRDLMWANGTPLSDSTPPAPTGGASAGTSNQASRSDHQHSLATNGLGYAVGESRFSSPVGPPRGSGDTGNSIPAGSIGFVPLPVFNAVTIHEFQVYIRNTGTAGATAQMAVYDSSPGSLQPRTRLAVIDEISSTSGGYKPFDCSPPLQLSAGLYWVGILAKVSSCGFDRLPNNSNAYLFACDTATSAGTNMYIYNSSGGGYSVHPTTLSTAEPGYSNTGLTWYQLSGTS